MNLADTAAVLYSSKLLRLDEVRRRRLLKLLADEEAKNILSSQHDASPGSACATPR